ncbi:L-lysine 6-monooxygenase (NADPH-requiring) protein [Rhizoctonia solani AG-3 Rhs1AP]|uniref:L-lysine 6-monooxygenase (NADPH-requiring) protein n=2 Tax=Rhizoctonia solani AG-3 TaxID=1086053 RepID=A0A074RPP0_9AGAM|nr:L-lysine 6-monooxygenase (NADPH-requiring) protein [Rhizoctonia solani AG-3 Rhs1AP]KEP46643.1 L-lysine 6-monooxygenase (NADPH-requiring) protein [Rhizoctonia solani 123E]
MSINIAIIGAGIGGITAAISLQNTLSVYDYTIYELASEIGGTWQQNNYPGCACDVAGHWYSLSSEPNPDWSRPYAPRQEIHEYWKRIVIKHQVEPHIRFNTEFVSAVWNEKEQNYTLRLRDVKSNQITQVTANVVISAVGFFRHPRWPEFPGRENFKGDLLHAQMWDHSVSLSGKRVALIGNGCAGSQILPVISEDSSTMVTNFCRTPSWYVPRNSKPVPEWLKWCFRHVPYALRSNRYLHVGWSEFFYQYFKLTPLSAVLRQRLEKVSLLKVCVYCKAPVQYHQYLIPNYAFGCKRTILDPGYLESLDRSNVEMEWDPITNIVPDGIQTKSGHKHQFDVIAFATGFDITSSLALDVTGVNGQRLQEYYDREGGPTGYMGTTIPGFPNWFTILGPNSITGHSSVVFIEELQVDYITQLLRPILAGDVQGFMPRADSTHAWNEWAQSKLGRHVWSGCASWYRAGPDGAKGKTFAVWPGGNLHMWWSLRKPTWKHFEVLGDSNWLVKQQISDTVSTLLKLGLISAGVGALVLMDNSQRVELVKLVQGRMEDTLAWCRVLWV